MRDPIELYEYPKEWIRRAEEKEGKKSVRQKIESGLYILSEDGWIKRGITTGTTSSLALVGAIESLYGEENSPETTASTRRTGCYSWRRLKANE